MRVCKLIIFLLVFHFQTAAQVSIQIILKTDIKIDNVDIFDLTQVEHHSSAYKDTVSFQFKKSNIDCYNIRYHEGEKMYRQQIWLDTGAIVIRAHIQGNDLQIDTVLNAPIFYKARDFYNEYADILKTKDTVKINNFLFDEYEKNIGNPFSYSIGHIILLQNQNSRLNLLNFKSLLDRQGNNFKWFLLYSLVVDRVNSILETDKIKISDFNFYGLDEKRTKLNLTTGADYYILDFWFLACAPCIREHKEIKSHLTQFKKQNIEIIGVSTDEPDKFKSCKDYLTKNKYLWKNYLQDDKNSLTDYLAVHSFPTYVVVNNKGDIIGSYNLLSDILRKYNLKE